MATNPPKKTAKTTPPKASQYNGWYVLAMLVEGIFGLFNSNKIYPAFGFLIFLIAGVITWRLPNTELAVIVKLLIEKFSSSSGTMMVLLLGSNLVWFILYRKMRSIFMNEIGRISSIRQELIHGGLPIKAHRSSEEANNEMYILPQKQGTTE